MPRIPVPRTSRFLSGLRPVQVSSASAGEAGGALQQFGQALGSATSQVANIMRQERERADELAVREALNKVDQYRIGAHYSKDGLFSLKGKDAMEAEGSGRDAYYEEVARIRDELPHENQRQLFDRAAQGRSNQFEQQLGSHTRAETQRYEGGVVKGALDGITQELPELRGSEFHDVKMHEGRMLLKGWLMEQGKSPEEIDEAVRKWEAQAYAGTLSAIEADDDPAALEHEIKNNPSFNALPPHIQARYERLVLKKTRSLEERTFVDDQFSTIMSDPSSLGPDGVVSPVALEKVKNLLNDITDLEKRARLAKAFDAEIAFHNSQVALAQNQAYEEAWDLLREGGFITEGHYDRMSGQQAHRIREAVMQRQVKDKTLRDDVALRKLNEALLEGNKDEADYWLSTIEGSGAHRRGATWIAASEKEGAAPAFLGSTRIKQEMSVRGYDEDNADHVAQYTSTLRDLHAQWIEENGNKPMRQADWDRLLSEVDEMVKVEPRGWFGVLGDKETQLWLTEEGRNEFMTMRSTIRDSIAAQYALENDGAMPSPEFVEQEWGKLREEALRGEMGNVNMLLDSVSEARHDNIAQRHGVTTPEFRQQIDDFGRSRGVVFSPPQITTMIDVMGLPDGPVRDSQIQAVIDRAEPLPQGAPSPAMPPVVAPKATGAAPEPTAEPQAAPSIEERPLSATDVDQGGIVETEQPEAAPEPKTVPYSSLTDDQKRSLRRKTRKLNIEGGLSNIAALMTPGKIPGKDVAFSKAARMIRDDFEATVERFITEMFRQTEITQGRLAVVEPIVREFAEEVKEGFASELELQEARTELFRVGANQFYNVMEPYIWIDTSIDDDAMVRINPTTGQPEAIVTEAAK